MPSPIGEPSPAMQTPEWLTRDSTVETVVIASRNESRGGFDLLGKPEGDAGLEPDRPGATPPGPPVVPSPSMVPSPAMQSPEWLARDSTVDSVVIASRNNSRGGFDPPDKPEGDAGLEPDRPGVQPISDPFPGQPLLSSDVRALAMHLVSVHERAVGALKREVAALRLGLLQGGRKTSQEGHEKRESTREAEESGSLTLGPAHNGDAKSVVRFRQTVHGQDQEHQHRGSFLERHLEEVPEEQARQSLVKGSSQAPHSLISQFRVQSATSRLFASLEEEAHQNSSIGQMHNGAGGAVLTAPSVNPSAKFELHEIWVDLPRPSGRRLTFQASAAFGKSWTLQERLELELQTETGRLRPPPTNQSWIIASPGSPRRLPWDFLGFFLILWDAIFIPLGVYSLPKSAFLASMDWVTRIYWTVDILMSFTLGYFREGEVITSFPEVALHYIKNTFFIDLFIVVMDWILTDSSLGILRVLRFARVVRLIRLFKLQKIMSWLQDHINSEYTKMFVEMIKCIMFILLVSHFVGCLYWILATSLSADGNNWVTVLDLEDSSLGKQYLSSFFMSLTVLLLDLNYLPDTSVELAFNIVATVMGLIGFSTVVSRITSLMMEIQNMRAETTQEFWKLRRYFREKKVPVELARRITRFLEYTVELKRRTIQESALPLLNLLTPELRNQLRYVGLMQTMKEHPLFRSLEQISDVTTHRMCEGALRERPLAERDPLFFQGEVGTHMGVVVRGEMLYVQKPAGSMASSYAFTQAYHGLSSEIISTPVGKNMFLAEAGLWVAWRYRGDAYAATECSVLVLDAVEFADTVARSTVAHRAVGRYAQRFVSRLRKEQMLGKRHSDLIEVRETRASRASLSEEEVYESDRLSMSSMGGDGRDSTVQDVRPSADSGRESQKEDREAPRVQGGFARLMRRA